MTYKCENPKCGKEYQPTVAWAKYCSYACGARIRNERCRKKRIEREKNLTAKQQ